MLGRPGKEKPRNNHRLCNIVYHRNNYNLVPTYISRRSCNSDSVNQKSMNVSENIFHNFKS